MAEIVEAMGLYLSHVKAYIDSRLGRNSDEERRQDKVRPVAQAFRNWFAECEKDPSWDALITASAGLFGDDSDKAGERGARTGVQHWFRREGLQHWFRREGVYASVLDGNLPDPAVVVAALAGAISAPEDRLVLLGLLEGVGLAKSKIEVGKYQIVRPDSKTLESLLGFEANRIFYPQAVTSPDRLTDHWYVLCEIRRPRRKPGRIYFEGFEYWEGGPVRAKYSGFHPAVEAAMKRIILWDWQGAHLETPREEFQGQSRWESFSVPFVLVSNDNPFEPPPPAPPIHMLNYEPLFNHSEREIGETPLRFFALDEEGTRLFEEFIQDADQKLQSILSIGEAWHFMDLGLNYLLKGFFSDGLEQMLWHIVTLEALLGERSPRVTERLSTRIESIYSADESRNERAGKAFGELYELRASLVHGRPFKRDAHSGHLRVARKLSQAVTVRMLDLLGDLAGKIKRGELNHVPSREEILGALDLERDARARWSELLRVFPDVRP